MVREGNALALTRASWALLRTDRRLAAVPALALVTGTALAVTFARLVTTSLHPRTRVYGSAYRTAGFGVPGANGPTSTAVTTLSPGPLTYVLLVIGYLLVVFTVAFASAVVSSLVQQHLVPGTDGRPSFAVALRVAARRTPQLLGWALMLGGIGMIHRFIEKRAVLGMIAGRVSGLSWRAASWLTVPVVVAEGPGPSRSLRRSADLFSATWGDGAVPRTGLGWIGTALFLPAVLAVGLVVVAPAVGIILAAVLFALALTTTTTLSGINRTALYLHATGQPVPGFDERVLALSFRPRTTALLPTPIAVAPPAAIIVPAALPLPGLVGRLGFPAVTVGDSDVLTRSDAPPLLPRRDRLRARPEGLLRPGHTGTAQAEPVAAGVTGGTDAEPEALPVPVG